MVTKEQIIINMDNNPISSSRVITAAFRRCANLKSNYACDSNDNAGHALADQLKRLMLQEMYNDVIKDLSDLHKMTGLTQEQLNHAIMDKIDKYKGVIDA